MMGGYFSEDPVLVSALKEGQDVHRRAAPEVFGVEPEQVTPKQGRRPRWSTSG